MHLLCSGLGPFSSQVKLIIASKKDLMGCQIYSETQVRLKEAPIA